VSEIFQFAAIAVFTYVGVEAFRRWTLRRKLLDVPNERSSHTNPTPRGGGLVLVVISLLIYTFYTGFVAGNFRWAYLSGAILIAGISWVDDLYTISFVWRFCAHIAAALLIIISLGFFQEVSLPFAAKFSLSGGVGMILTVLWIVWLTNAYNFMDGIDGIAGIQTISAGLGWLLLGNLYGAESNGFYGGVLAFTGLGFLIQNWQPAKIFMGDVGSAFLGFTFAAMPLLCQSEIETNVRLESLLPAAALFMNWLFLFDTIYTFTKRLLRREKVWEAHRGHLYQRLVISGYSHRSVAALYGILSLSTCAVTIAWIRNREPWESVLVGWVILQSVGILGFLLFFSKNKS
jgi:UDP-N-acetylmuramyl pentapeptide phosphotransferase/UDP-N-acetylglucosamine-1-phosphate transferase